MNKLTFLTTLIGCLMLSGCTLNPAITPAVTPAITPGSSHAQALVAQDMVNVLMQTAELSATTTTLYFPALRSTNDSFAQTLIRKFEDAGYAVRTTGSNSGEALVSYELARDKDPQHGAIDTYTVSIGAISVRRAYVTIENNQVRPLTPMQIKGTSAAGLHLDNRLFDTQLIGAMPEENRIAERDATAQEAPLLDIVAPTTYSVAGQNWDASALRELSKVPTRNVRELGQSNFADAFARLAIVQEIILTFDNDSVRMGPVNKTRVSELVGLFNGTTDVFSVIGCSNGATSLTIGQEGLALGRAERVKEELLFAGVPDESILKEGCWAGETYDERMPRRGVVLSLKRRPA